MTSSDFTIKPIIFSNMDYNISIIFGNQGSGKTSLIKNMLYNKDSNNTLVFLFSNVEKNNIIILILYPLHIFMMMIILLKISILYIKKLLTIIWRKY